MEVCNVHPFKIREIPRYSMTDNYVGLLLITYNDAENLEQMLPTLEATLDYPTIIHVMDMGSTDCSVKIIADWYELQTNSNLVDLSIDKLDKLESLAKTMNRGFKYLMSRQECNMIGWIHPDMLFEEGWLSNLVSTLSYQQNIGKVCAYNPLFSCVVPDEIYDGQEQCYLILRGNLLKVGLFDEQFLGIGGYEDWDLNTRIRKEGLRIVIQPKSIVKHKGMGTRGKRNTSFDQMHNGQIYQKKWGTHKELVI